MKRTPMTWLILVVILAAGAGAGAGGMALASSGSGTTPGSVAGPGGAQGSPSPGGQGMMGGGGSGAGTMMGGGSDIGAGTPGGLVPATRMESLATAAARTVDRHGSTLTYTTQNVSLVALGAPGNRSGMYWQIDGVDNPTIVVPAGATVTVEFADGDPGHPHSFELTTAAPPYPRMAMMDGHIAAPGAFIMPVPPPEGNLWYAATTTFRAPSPGTYYVICPVPGHAQQGMWARFVVR